MIDDFAILFTTIMCIVVIWRARILDRRPAPGVPGVAKAADPDTIFQPAATGAPARDER